MSKMKSKALSFLLILSLFVGMVSIINIDAVYAASKKKIHLKKTTVSLAVGKTYQQKLIDKKGKTIKATKVKWKSKKASIAKINKKGKITAVRAGTAKMTAKYKGKTYKFTVYVSTGMTITPITPTPAYHNFISADSYDISLEMEESKSVIVKSDKGFSSILLKSENDNVNYKWGSDSENGRELIITGVRKGISRVTIYDSRDKIASASIFVNVLPNGNKSISVDSNKTTMCIGDTQTFLISTDRGKDIFLKSDSSSVSCSLDEWIPETNTRNMTITGLTEGSAAVYVCDSIDENCYARIDVNVRKWTISFNQQLPLSNGEYYSTGSGPMNTGIIESVELEYVGDNGVKIHVKGESTLVDASQLSLRGVINDENGAKVESVHILTGAYSAPKQFDATDNYYLTQPLGHYTLEFQDYY
ncbi:MAG: Ig-like domain-containing protein [Aeriscardovia sp.]|nr:Ig-like domain-containing protein [Aeriscardovia sp.]